MQSHLHWVHIIQSTMVYTRKCGLTWWLTRYPTPWDLLHVCFLSNYSPSQRAIIRHASDYKKAKMWIPLLRYCDLATRRAEAMPDWEGKRYQKAIQLQLIWPWWSEVWHLVSHTQAKAATYKNLAGFWTAALKGARLAAEELVVWRDRWVTIRCSSCYSNSTPSPPPPTLCRLSKYNSNGPIIENKNGRTRVFNNTICQLDKLLAKSKWKGRSLSFVLQINHLFIYFCSVHVCSR